MQRQVYLACQRTLALPPDPRVLEADCGKARVSALLRSAGYSAAGSDLVMRTLAAVKATASRLEVLAADVRRLPMANHLLSEAHHKGRTAHV